VAAGSLPEDAARPLNLPTQTFRSISGQAAGNPVDLLGRGYSGRHLKQTATGVYLPHHPAFQG